ncbi:MAG: DRTGG domain-containing protein [bacterium]|nr:DRTGG domain-containing protein [bacterium]
MKLSEVVHHLEASVLAGGERLGREAIGAYAADLLSDVLKKTLPDAVLLTGLTNPQVVRTAEIMDLAAVVFVRNKRVTPDIIALAAEKGLVLLGTRRSLYESCGLLYRAGLPPVPSPGTGEGTDDADA